MLELYIVRHAKASREEIDIKDRERPLLSIGIQRANKVSTILKKKKILPGKIISSHALRALNTAVIFALNMDYPVRELEISHSIYGKTPETVLDLIKKQNNDISSLMIFGHNPTFTDLYNLLTGDALENLSTSAVACMQFDTENWAKIQAKMGQTQFIETGK